MELWIVFSHFTYSSFGPSRWLLESPQALCNFPETFPPRITSFNLDRTFSLLFLLKDFSRLSFTFFEPILILSNKANSAGYLRFNGTDIHWWMKRRKEEKYSRPSNHTSLRNSRDLVKTNPFPTGKSLCRHLNYFANKRCVVKPAFDGSAKSHCSGKRSDSSEMLSFPLKLHYVCHNVTVEKILGFVFQ